MYINNILKKIKESNIMSINKKIKKLKRFNAMVFGGFVGLAFIALLEIFPLHARIDSLLFSDDVQSREIRAVTMESWDRDYSGGGYGWEVTTNKDKKLKGSTQASVYNSNDSSLQAEREVKLVAGTSDHITINEGNQQAQILAIRFAFTFPGDNVVSISPPKVDKYTIERYRNYISESAVKKATAVRKSCYKDPNLSIMRRVGSLLLECLNGIEFPGNVKEISVWVLGRGNDYNLEAMVEDWRGEVHSLKMGSVNFVGWRPLRVKIPRNIPQSADSFPQTRTLIFRKFKLVKSRVSNFDGRRFEDVVYIFFDELRVLVSGLHYFTNEGAGIHFDKVDCERKNRLFKRMRENSRVPDRWPAVQNCQ